MESAQYYRIHFVKIYFMEEKKERKKEGEMCGKSCGGHSPRPHSLLRVVIIIIMAVKLTTVDGGGNVASTGEEGRNGRRGRNNKVQVKKK